MHVLDSEKQVWAATVTQKECGVVGDDDASSGMPRPATCPRMCSMASRHGGTIARSPGQNAHDSSLPSIWMLKHAHRNSYNNNRGKMSRRYSYCHMLM
mmetsp:Transcript_5444/g.7571  ORF Transcript_5444/g.7571 Transcript_5444/m.7571 type:complete len:98 (+) Transcript_5444:345-638(+)